MDDWISSPQSFSTNQVTLDFQLVLSGQHSWHTSSHARPTYCNICREQLTGITSHGLSCEVCKFKVHKRCVAKAINNCKWTTLGSLGKDIIEDKFGNVVMPHQWLEGNLPVSSKCSICAKTCGSVLRLQDWKCLWCRMIVHTACRPNPDVQCPLGLNKISVVPPTAIHCIGTDDTWEAVRPQGCSPLLVFVNSKSGDNQGIKFLKRFRQLLNPAQVFDLIGSGPALGLRLFRNFDPFRVLICSGDGSVGWVLSEIDRLNMQLQCEVGVLPLGTGNDLARVLGWGSSCDDDTHVSHLIERYEKASHKILDRWSVMVYERNIKVGDGGKIVLNSVCDQKILLNTAVAYEDSVLSHLTHILQSDKHSSVIHSAKVLCETVKDFISKVSDVSLVQGDTAFSDKCQSLKLKLDRLVNTLHEEQLQVEQDLSEDTKMLAAQTRLEPCLSAEEPCLSAEEHEIAESKSVKTDNQIKREQLLLRVNSLKKAVRRVVEHTEKAIDEQNLQSPFDSTSTQSAVTVKERGDATLSIPMNHLTAISPIPECRRTSSTSGDIQMDSLPVPTEFADSSRHTSSSELHRTQSETLLSGNLEDNFAESADKSKSTEEWIEKCVTQRDGLVDDDSREELLDITAGGKILEQIGHIDSSDISDEDKQCRIDRRRSLRSSFKESERSFPLSCDAIRSELDLTNLISSSPEDEEEGSEEYRANIGIVIKSSKCSIAHFVEGNDIARKSVKCRHEKRRSADDLELCVAVDHQKSAFCGDNMRNAVNQQITASLDAFCASSSDSRDAYVQKKTASGVEFCENNLRNECDKSRNASLDAFRNNKNLRESVFPGSLVEFRDNSLRNGCCDEKKTASLDAFCNKQRNATFAAPMDAFRNDDDSQDSIFPASRAAYRNDDSSRNAIFRDVEMPRLFGWWRKQNTESKYSKLAARSDEGIFYRIGGMWKKSAPGSCTAVSRNNQYENGSTRWSSLTCSDTIATTSSAGPAVIIAPPSPPNLLDAEMCAIENKHFLGASSGWLSQSCRRLSAASPLMFRSPSPCSSRRISNTSQNLSTDSLESGRVPSKQVAPKKTLPIITPLVRLPQWPDVAAETSMVGKALLQNADALCAPAMPLIDLDETIMEGFYERCVMNNYFGIGIDAKISLDFHQKREEHPEKCRSRTRNYMWYGVLGSKQWLQKTCKNLEQRVQLECDGYRIPLPSLQGIVILNIPSFMGGINFWGGNKEDDIFVAPSFDDHILEVVAVFGTVQMAASRLINLQHHRIAQCTSVQINILGDEGVPVQVDGEAWIQPPGMIRIMHKNRIKVLCRNKSLENSLKTWEEKLKQAARGMPTRVHSAEEKLSSFTDDELSVLLAFIEAATSLMKQVKLLVIRYPTIRGDLYSLAEAVGAALEQVHPNGKLLTGYLLRTQATELYSSVQKLYDETCSILKVEKDLVIPSVVSQLNSALSLVEMELKKCSYVHCQSISENPLISFTGHSGEDRFTDRKSVSRSSSFWQKFRRASASSSRHTRREITGWGAHEVGLWLESLELAEYVETFNANDIHGKELLSLTRRDLKELGVNKLGHIKRILLAVKEMA